ncbi:pyridoxamine 5'-phosphate oxidase family protein [Streptomyces sp. NPDC088785]|uniref:pyridoxamine 5'-phosphate oxidase family protein n=1 Tax=Streptomyces sp. NPDC088785 TaxID=3365897 RepID=UPI003810273F
MTSNWSAFRAAEPDLATTVEDRFGAFTHHVLATLRKDGSPRTCGLEVRFLDGELWLGMMAGSLKALDLLRDPRCALQANPGEGTSMGGGDVRVSGRALLVEDEPTVGRYTGQVAVPDPSSFHLFRVEVTEVTRTSVRDDAYLLVEVWTPDGGLRSVRRT